MIDSDEIIQLIDDYAALATADPDAYDQIGAEHARVVQALETGREASLSDDAIVAMIVAVSAARQTAPAWRLAAPDHGDDLATQLSRRRGDLLL